MLSFLKAHKKLVLTLARGALAIGFSLLLCNFNFYFLEYFAYDMSFRLSPSTSTSEQIQTVIIDSDTLEKLGAKPSLSQHTEVLKAIHAQNPLAVIYFDNPSRLAGSVGDRQNFVEIAQGFRNFYVNIDDAPDRENIPKFIPKNEFEALNYVPGPTTRDAKFYAEDGVSRRILTWYDGVETLHYQVASLISPMKYDGYQGNYDQADTVQVYTDFRPTGSYPPINFATLLKGNSEASLKDKVVLIGSASFESFDDFLKTPYSRDPTAMTKLEVHANMLDTLVQDSGIIWAPKWFTVLATCLVSLFAVFAIFNLPPIRGLIALLGAAVVYVLIAYVAFAAFNVAVGTAHPLLIIFVCYYFFIPYRLIKESRKSWEYQQKNRLLMQVEELKSNFISMMSHDLKTPLARIHGMADVALKETSNMTPTQYEAVMTIRSSTEELTELVTSILDLGRIESQRVKLNLTGKDLNTLTKEVVQRYAHLAQVKNIEVVQHLEPLFSVRVDEDLIRQVISNLVENAIKYSPEGSQVSVRADEVGNKIIIQVSDQGAGIPKDEISNIFMKFYRSKDAKSSPIKGTGLGLYLAKYFVELHKGTLSVESTTGEGSTFRVEIPTDL